MQSVINQIRAVGRGLTYKVQQMTPQQKAGAGLAACLLIVLGLFVGSRALLWLPALPSAGPTPVTLTTVGTVQRPFLLELPAALESRQASIISAEIAGRISEVYVAAGDTVKAGQKLLKLEGTPQTVVTGSTAPNAQTSDAAAMAPPAQSAYDAALQEYTRYKKLYEQGGIARRKLEESAARLQQAQSELSSPAAAAPAAGAAGTSGELHLPGQAILTAPSDGIITSLSAAAGQSATAGQPLLVVNNGGDVQAAALLEQTDLYLIHSGTTASIVVKTGAGKAYAGQVERITPYNQNGKNMFRAQIRFDNSDAALEAGMTATVYLHTDNTYAAKAVPSTAIRSDFSGQYLYAVENDKAVRYAVTTGSTIDGYTEITSALPSELAIIADPPFALWNGSLVTEEQ